VGPGIDALVARAIAPRPDDRFATADEFAEALAARAPVGVLGVRTRTPCAACKMPLVVDLPFCPGCGRDTSWDLRPGPYAVLITATRDPGECFDWLRRRYSGALTLAPALPARLRNLPVLLAIGVSLESAEQLVVEAADAGCEAELVRARKILGLGAHASSATSGETLAAVGLHLGGVALVIGVVGLLRLEPIWAIASPGVLAVTGALLAGALARRPLLNRRHGERTTQAVPDLPQVREHLRSLTTVRARRLAAGAVTRAAPLLAGTVAAAEPEREQALEKLLEAVAAASDLDKHAVLLQARSRSRLAVEFAQARSRADQGDPAAVEDLVALESERTGLVEASLAHDLASRRALDATSAISAALRFASAPGQKIDRLSDYG